MSTLYLDFGNTRVKCFWRQQFIALDYAELEPWLRESACRRELERVVLASVLSEPEVRRWADDLRQWLAVPVLRCVVTREALGVRCAYADVGRLGIDRWLAVLAAWSRTGGACVVADLGTAATVDLVDQSGCHLGGYIISGLELAVRGLLAGTANIRPDREGFADANPQPGTSTAQAIYHGALASVVALIHSCQEQLLKSDPATKLIITGGDAALVAPHLRCHHEQVQELVFEGMALLEQAGLLVNA
ncbi:MAG: hypothetical protein CML06_18110 [Pseudomonadales bacterium]|nr:hypothetical protein [Pseudomonadales bacterium]